MCCPPQGKLVLFWIDVLEHRPRHKHTQSTLISGTWLDVTRQLPTLLFGKPKTITVSHNRQRWEQRLDRLHLPAHTSTNGDQAVYCPNSLPHQKKKKTLLYPPFALGMCVRMVYTLKTNRRPIATAREMDVGLDEVGDNGRRDGMEWKEGGGEREAGYTRRGGGREGGGVWGKRVKVVIKTTIIRSLSATQWPHQGWCNDRLCWTHVRLSEGVCECVCVSVNACAPFCQC